MEWSGHPNEEEGVSTCDSATPGRAEQGYLRWSTFSAVEATRARRRMAFAMAARRTGELIQLRPASEPATVNRGDPVPERTTELALSSGTDSGKGLRAGPGGASAPGPG